MKKIEFYITPNGKIYADENGVSKEFNEKCCDLASYTVELIKKQYPSAYIALEELYRSSALNKNFLRFKIAHRFIRCNFGKFDGLTFDIEGDVLHIEDISCPLKYRNDCKFNGIICKPKPLGLTDRETEIAKSFCSGQTYKEISSKLGIEHSTIKNTLQKIRKKLHLSSTKDIAKFIIATL